MKSPRGFTTDILILAFVLLAVGGYYYVHGGFHLSPAVSTILPIRYELRTVTDVNSTTTLPYVVKYPNTAVMNEVNHQIDEISHDYTCIIGATDEELRDELRNSVFPTGLTKVQIAGMNRQQIVDELKWYSEVGIVGDAADIYAKNGIFSFEYYFNENCGGPHENSSSIGLIFDMRSGKNIGSKDMFKNFEADKDPIEAVLFQAYAAENKKLYTNPATGEYERDCLDGVAYPDSFDYSEFYISSTSQLIMTPDFPYATRACANDTPVSITALRPYLPPDSPLLRLVK